MALKEEKPDLLAVMQSAGVDLARAGNRRCLTLRCPFHEDRGRPNLAVWPASGRWRCFRCDAGGDVFDFVGMLVYGRAWNARDRAMFKEVLRRLDVSSVPRQVVQPLPISAALSPLRVQILELASRVYHLSLMSPAGQPAREALAARGIDPPAQRRYRIGFAAPGALVGVLAGYPGSLARLAEEAGLFHEGREWLQGRIVFPDLGRSGAVRHMIGRAVERAAQLRYLSLPGLPKTIWGLDGARRSAPVVLTESVIDALNLRQLGLQGVAVCGTGLAQPLADQLRRVPLLYILPQNDPAGAEAVARWQALLPRARVLDAVAWGMGKDGAPRKDFNDLWVDLGRAEAGRILRAALAVAGVESSSETKTALR